MSPHAEEVLDGFYGLGTAASHINEPSPRPNRSHLRRHDPPPEIHDLICVGFGPANLALAIALHDALDKQLPGLASIRSHPPKVLFLEKQPHFAWHEGMLLPGAKMQISFIKDLATLRDPRSEFTFLNYLHMKNRLVQFTNLDTFLPQRIEYQDYMEWCAGWFDEVVEYGHRVVSITPDTQAKGSHFEVLAMANHADNCNPITFRGRHVVVGVGGNPHMPEPFPHNHPRVLHSSQYATSIPTLLQDPLKPYRVAIVGGGQSAAEIFNDLHSRYPNATTTLVIKSAALKPSDDSPFVNEVFDPTEVDHFYDQPGDMRRAALAEDRGTNYGVVRLELLEQIYATLYAQRVRHAEESDWQHRILKHRTVVGVETEDDSVRLLLRSSSGESAPTLNGNASKFNKDASISGDIMLPANGATSTSTTTSTTTSTVSTSTASTSTTSTSTASTSTTSNSTPSTSTISPATPLNSTASTPTLSTPTPSTSTPSISRSNSTSSNPPTPITTTEPSTPNTTTTITSPPFDALIIATGYTRTSHLPILAPCRHLMPGGGLPDEEWTVGRDYGIIFGDGKVGDDAGVWLQGCNEGTHGLSDTLLSILAPRGGELVRSIFGDR